jgi:hypothetical protein
MPLSGEQVWRWRAHEGLEQGGTSLEGASSPERGGTSPEGGRPTLERGGTSLDGATGPRARRNLTRGGDQPSSEAEGCLCGVVPLEPSGVSPEGGWVDSLVGHWGHLGRGPVSLPYECFGYIYILFFVSFKGKWVSLIV